MKPAELHLYDADRQWQAGGAIVEGLSRDEALARAARVDGLRFYQWADRAGELRPLPATDGGEVLPVFASDVRDRHLLGDRDSDLPWLDRESEDYFKRKRAQGIIR